MWANILAYFIHYSWLCYTNSQKRSHWNSEFWFYYHFVQPYTIGRFHISSIALDICWFAHHCQVRSGQSLSRVQLFAGPWITARQASLSINNSWSSLKLTSIESVMPSSHLILCCPLLRLPLIPPSIKDPSIMGSQRVGHDWVTELNWTDSILKAQLSICC